MHMIVLIPYMRTRDTMGFVRGTGGDKSAQTERVCGEHGYSLLRERLG